MRRKLIKQGRGGLTFYVPKKWIDERQLVAGDDINIEENEDRIVLSSDKIPPKKEITITIENESREFTRNYLNQLYRLGYDRIRINCTNKENLIRCQKLVQLFLLGFEVTKVEKDFCIIENLSEPREETDEILLRRVFLLIEESYDLVIQDITSKKPAHKEDIERNTRRITQYDNFYRRNLVRKNLGYGKHFFLWEIYSFILLIQHNIFHLYDKSKYYSLNKEELDYMKSIKSDFQRIHSAFYKKDLKELDKLQSESNALFNKIRINNRSSSLVNSYFLSESARLNYLVCAPMISFIQANQ